MITVRETGARLVAFFRKRELDCEFNEELAAHIELATQEYLSQGMSFSEARRRAIINLGGIEQSRELHRESRGLPWLDGIVQDIRLVLRGLRKNPGFTLTAIGILAVGIGVNGAVFTVSKAALFSGFPLVQRNDRLVYIAMSRGCCVSYPDFIDWRSVVKSFQGMAIVHGALRVLSDPSGFPQSYDVAEVSADTFKLTGQHPFLGRDFEPSDEISGAPAVAILSYAFWQLRFGADPTIVGKAVRVNGEPTTVIGVMPQGFSFPQKLDLWVPLVQTPEVMKRENRGQWFVVARLADGVTIRNAQVEMETIGRRLGLTYPLTNQGRNLRPIVQTFREFFILQNETPVYWAMWGAVGFVLLIACANLANLMLARTIGRAREMSVRRALGATNWRIIRERLVESVILSGVGGVLGCWIARRSVAAYALVDRGPGRSSWRILDYSLDYRVLGYILAVSIGTAFLFGLLPALRLSRFDASTAMKDGGRGITAGRRGKRLSTALVIAEIALAVVLLAGAGVMIRSFLNLYTADLGLKTNNILTMAVSLPNTTYTSTESYISFYERIKTSLEQIPGVDSVAMASALPALGATRVPYELDASAPIDEQRRPTLLAVTIDPDYFRTLGVALVSGRTFNDSDRGVGLPVMMVNRRFADAFWPGQNPLGKRLRLFDGKQPGPWLHVIGVAPNIAARNTGANDGDALVYLPYRQKPVRSMEIIARTRVPPAGLALDFRRTVQRIDFGLPIFGPLTLDERLEGTYYSHGLFGVLFLLFATIALLLASIGLYAVIAYSVRRRTQEIGVRIAVGARPSDILYLVLQQGLLPLATGLGVGLAASFALNGILKAELVHVSPSDPTTLIVASAVLIFAATLGCWIPARRAMRVDPVVALRYE